LRERRYKLPEWPHRWLTTRARVALGFALPQLITAETIDDLPEPLKSFALRTEATLVHHTLQLTYTSFTYEEVMQRL